VVSIANGARINVPSQPSGTKRLNR